MFIYKKNIIFSNLILFTCLLFDKDDAKLFFFEIKLDVQTKRKKGMLLFVCYSNIVF
jgi:hypothetical protein